MCCFRFIRRSFRLALAARHASSRRAPVTRILSVGEDCGVQQLGNIIPDLASQIGFASPRDLPFQRTCGLELQCHGKCGQENETNGSVPTRIKGDVI